MDDLSLRPADDSKIERLYNTMINSVTFTNNRKEIGDIVYDLYLQSDMDLILLQELIFEHNIGVCYSVAELIMTQSNGNQYENDESYDDALSDFAEEIDNESNFDINEECTLNNIILQTLYEKDSMISICAEDDDYAWNLFDCQNELLGNFLDRRELSKKDTVFRQIVYFSNMSSASITKRKMCTDEDILKLRGV